MAYIKAGSQPGPGDYLCLKCNAIIRIYSDGQVLPCCPNPCGGCYFQKLRSLGSNK